jgi:hypothetical protein
MNSLNSDFVKAEISKILNIPNNDNWEIYDSIPTQNLYLIHYTNNADLNVYGFYRGIIIDLKTRKIVCKSRTGLITITTDKIIPNPDQTLILKDDYGIVHNLKKYKIDRGFESTTIRKWKYNGIVYLSTYKRIDAREISWGNYKNFQTIYTELGGLPDKDLWPESVKYSPYVYEFLLVHRDLLACSKLPVGSGMIIYNGLIKKVWEFSNNPYNSESHEPYNITGTSILPLYPKEPVIYNPTEITISEANNHLHSGFYEAADYSKIDKRLTPGEFVVITQYDEKDSISKMFKVQCNAYKFKSSMINNNPNLKQRVYELLTDSYNPQKLEDSELSKIYKSKYPILPPIKSETLLDALNINPFILFPVSSDFKESDVNLCDKEERYYNIILCLLMSVSLDKQADVLLYYSELLESRIKLIKYINNLTVDSSISEDPEFKRINNIIYEAKKQARKIAYDKTGISHMYKSNLYTTGYISNVDKEKNYNNLLYRNIYSFIMKERGDSLFKLMKVMQKHGQ